MRNTMDRYTVRRLVNDLIDRLICEGVSKQEIIEMIDEDDFYSDSDKEYFDINWLYSNDMMDSFTPYPDQN